MLRILAGTIVWYNGAKFAVELMLRNPSALLLCFKMARRDATNHQTTHTPSKSFCFALNAVYFADLPEQPILPEDL